MFARPCVIAPMVLRIRFATFLCRVRTGRPASLMGPVWVNPHHRPAFQSKQGETVRNQRDSDAIGTFATPFRSVSGRLCAAMISSAHTVENGVSGSVGVNSSARLVSGVLRRSRALSVAAGDSLATVGRSARNHI